MKVTVTAIVIETFGRVLKDLERGTGRVGCQRTSRDHPNYSIVKIE